MWLVDHPAELDAMRPRARMEFECKYSAGVNLTLLLQAYRRARSTRPWVRHIKDGRRGRVVELSG